jgi:hypothetical protein
VQRELTAKASANGPQGYAKATGKYIHRIAIRAGDILQAGEGQ